ncbi:hypothetical protein [Streptomyces cinereoruber]|uniref:hypothetical protein n=1 Tax=Streptomyces cinereoruber TaxID=67260 RepID=UPI0036294FB7
MTTPTPPAADLDPTADLPAPTDPPGPTAPAPTDLPAPTDPAPDPTAPSTRALRVLALCGFFLLAGCLVLTAVLGLVDAVEGDGVGGGFLTAGLWSLALGAAAGTAALAVPRRALVAAQYALAFAAPVLAALD